MYMPEESTADVIKQYVSVSIDADLYKPIYEKLRSFFPVDPRSRMLKTGACAEAPYTSFSSCQRSWRYVRQMALMVFDCLPPKL